MATQTQKQTAATAIIVTGGKQVRVTAGQVVTIEKIDGEVGKKVTFDNLVMVANGADIQTGSELQGTLVTGEITEQGKAPKIRVFTYKSKKRQRRTLGHRQPITKVKILAIGGSKTAEKAPKAEKPAKAAPKRTPKK